MIPSRRVSVAAASALVAALLTVATAVLHWRFTPSPGFVRTFHPTGDFGAPPALEDRTTGVSLEFMGRNPSLPRRSFGVQWRGFWHVPDRRTLELQVTSDDEVQLLVGSKVVIWKSPRELPRTTRRLLTLAKGSHEVVIRYRQHGRGMGLAVHSSAAGATPAPLPTASIFTSPPRRSDLAIAAAVPWLMALTAVVWVMAALPAIADGLGASRRAWGVALATPREFARRLRLLAGPALLGPIVMFLVGPLTIHAANPDEFVVSATDLVWPWTIGAVVISWGALLAIGAVVAMFSEWLSRVLAAVLLAVGLLLWAQGTLLVPDYGPLYGEALDLAAFNGRVPYELALWAGVLGLAIVYARQVSRIAALLSLVFISLQVAAIVVSLAGGMQARGRAQSEWSGPPAALYTLSRSQNVFHIVLDAYLSELFGEAVAEDRAFFDRTFSGFVYFADHLGAFPTTRASMPAMLTGEAYRNQEPFEQFPGPHPRAAVDCHRPRRAWLRSAFDHLPSARASVDRSGPSAGCELHHPDAIRQLRGLRTVHRASVVRLRRVPSRATGAEGLRVQRRHVALAARLVGEDASDSQRSRMMRPSNHAAFLDGNGRSADGGRRRPRLSVHPHRRAASPRRARRGVFLHAARRDDAPAVRGAVALRDDDSRQAPRSASRVGRLRPVGRRHCVGPRLACDTAGPSAGGRLHPRW